jgi:hypothetical protein
MRFTLNIDGDLLDRVVEATGSKTKTDAITFALEEVDRRARLRNILREGTGATSDELKRMFDPASDPVSLRVAEPGAPCGKRKE